MLQFLHDFLCDKSHVLISIDRNQIAFFLIIRNEWCCIFFIYRKSITCSLLSVIITLIQGATIIIAYALNLWWIEKHMICCFASWTKSTTSQSCEDRKSVV